MNHNPTYPVNSEVIVRVSDATWITEAPNRELITMQVTGYHPAEINPYDIFRVLPDSNDYEAVCDEDSIVCKAIPTCKDCGSEKIYHDRKEYRICPWCEL